MKKLQIRNLLLILVCVITTLLSHVFIIVAQTPYKSFVINRDGELSESSPLYEPSHIINYPFEELTNIYVHNNDNLYVVEREKIVIFDQHSTFLKTIGENELVNATSVFVNADGYIYVVDYDKEVIIIFSSEGDKVQEIGRPDSPVYGNETPFKPVKVAVDKRGNLYVVSEGTTHGIVQMNSNGEFQGFFGVNATRISWIKALQNMLFDDSMTSQFMATIPPSISNIAIDSQGIIYTITKGDSDEAIKKLNIAGTNLLPKGMITGMQLESVTTDNDGNMFLLSGETGQMIILDSFGNLVGIFGAKSEDDLRLGINHTPIEIEVNSKRNLYIVDQGTNQIKVYTPTPLMYTMFDAIALYKDGQYVESQDLWTEVLMFNSSISLAHHAMGLSRFKQQDYDQALSYFYQANDVASYSDAFWEIRQVWLEDHMQSILLFIILAIALRQGAKYVNRKTTLFRPLNRIIQRFKRNRIVKELREALRVLKHPNDTFYRIKYQNSISLLCASILFSLIIVSYLATFYYTGFIFNPINPVYISVFEESFKLIGLIILFIGANYLIGSIREGEGKLRDVIISSACAFVPIVILWLPITIISNFLTLNESFLYSFGLSIMVIWSFVLVFIMVIEIHNYTFKETVTHLLIMVFTMIIIFIVLLCIYVLSTQAYEFIKSMVMEVSSRG